MAADGAKYSHLRWVLAPLSMLATSERPDALNLTATTVHPCWAFRAAVVAIPRVGAPSVRTRVLEPEGASTLRADSLQRLMPRGAYAATCAAAAIHPPA